MKVIGGEESLMPFQVVFMPDLLGEDYCLRESVPDMLLQRAVGGWDAPQGLSLPRIHTPATLQSLICFCSQQRRSAARQVGEDGKAHILQKVKSSIVMHMFEL